MVSLEWKDEIMKGVSGWEMFGDVIKMRKLKKVEK
jgi:hypothetical protein